MLHTLFARITLQTLQTLLAFGSEIALDARHTFLALHWANLIEIEFGIFAALTLFAGNTGNTLSTRCTSRAHLTRNTELARDTLDASFAWCSIKAWRTVSTVKSS